MVCAPVRSIIHSLKLGDYLSVQAHKPCSISHLFAQKKIDFLSSKVMFRARLFKATSLVNETLKFWTFISQICQYFLLKKKCESFCGAKASLIFPTKNISVFGNEVAKHLASWPQNEFITLTMLWTTGPRSSISNYVYLVACMLFSWINIV